MTDTTGAEQPTEAYEAPKPAPTQTPAKADTDWKAEAKKWESRAKENSSAAARLAEIEEAKKTNEQRLEERATAAEKLAASNALSAARASIALEKGLTASQAKRLVGSTEEELAADADDLLADLGTKTSFSPRADHSQGPKSAVGEQSPQSAFTLALQEAVRR